MQPVVVGDEIRYEYRFEEQYGLVYVLDGMAVIELEYGNCHAVIHTKDFLSVSYQKKWFSTMTQRYVGQNTPRGRTMHKLTVKICDMMYKKLVETSKKMNS